jgi:hypothetical protein
LEGGGQAAQRAIAPAADEIGFGARSSTKKAVIPESQARKGGALSLGEVTHTLWQDAVSFVLIEVQSAALWRNAEFRATLLPNHTLSVYRLPMNPDSLDRLKLEIREIGAKYSDRLDRSRRIYIENRARALHSSRDIEYAVKGEISKYFAIDYSDICFCGSAQLGFSVYKDRLFVPQTSDLDVACVNTNLFQNAWVDVISASRAFSDYTVFAGLSPNEIDTFKDQILRRGMIRIKLMPRSLQSTRWRQFEDRTSRRYAATFGSVSIAIYMNEYAFCWKQDAALNELMGR